MDKKDYLYYKMCDILLKIYGNENKDSVHNLFYNCFYNKIILPRFEFISIIDTFTEYMIKDNSKNKDKLEYIRNQIYTYLFTTNNDFDKVWKNGEIPDYINKLYLDNFGDELYDLMSNVITDDDIFNEEVKIKCKKYQKDFLNPSKITISIKQNNKISLPFEIEKEYDPTEQKLIHQVGYKQKQKDLEEQQKYIGIKHPHGLTKTQQIIDFKYMNTVAEIKKLDKYRFDKIFFFIHEHFNIDLTTEEKNMLTNIWYGDYYKEHSDSLDILSIVEKYDLNFKISNKKIDSNTSRLILQTYLVALYIGLNIYDIYTIINLIILSEPTLYKNKISPIMIHNGNIPDIKIQKILTPIINKLHLDKNQIIIRDNWNKLRYPDIDITKLVDKINNINIPEETKFKIIVYINDLSSKVINKGYTLQMFRDLIYKYINKTIKIKIKKDDIIDLITYK